MRFPLALLAFLILPWSPADAIDLRARSTSSSRQFTVYCEDLAVRRRVVSFVEEVKLQTLDVFKQADHWKIPIVVTIEPGEAPQPVTVRLVQTPEGPSIQVGAKFGENPAAVHLQRHIIRAVMLDYLYRNRPALTPGATYVEAPWWFVRGVIEQVRRKEHGIDAGFYRHLVEKNSIPPIEQFLAGHGLDLGETAAAFDSSCALVLLDMLMEQPEGRTRLGSLLREWPDRGHNQIAALTHAFPGLGEGAEGMQKWWTLSFARFSASDRYLGLSAADTDRELAALLQFKVVTDKQGRTTPYSIGQFEEFVKKPGAKSALSTQRQAVIALSTRASAIFRPVLMGYEEIFALLLKGKTKGIADRIHAVEVYRTTVLHRMSDITDYLNWYEATQMGGSLRPFGSYLRTAKELELQPPQTAMEKAIADYLDLVGRHLSAE